MPKNEPKCPDCQWFAQDEADSYCTHPVVFDKTDMGFGRRFSEEIPVMRAPGGLCAGGKLFKLAVKRRGG